MIKQYETVFIATPVLSDIQMKEAVAKYTQLIRDNGGEIVYEEDWGLKQLAYPIQHKTSGFYYLIEFKADPQFVGTLETQYHRDPGQERHRLRRAPSPDPRRQGCRRRCPAAGGGPQGRGRRD